MTVKEVVVTAVAVATVLAATVAINVSVTFVLAVLLDGAYALLGLWQWLSLRDVVRYWQVMLKA